MRKAACNVDGCGGVVFARGMCQKHYTRYRKSDEFILLRRASEGTCSVDYCDLVAKVKGLCKKHYLRQIRYGDPNYVKQEKHGLSHLPEHSVWANMINRCNPDSIGQDKDYISRNITVCERWRNSFPAFYEDMGPRPFSHYQIDRIDNGGNYEPTNCHWVSPAINARNRRSTILDMDKARNIRQQHSAGITTKALSEEYGVSTKTILSVVKCLTWKENEETS